MKFTVTLGLYELLDLIILFLSPSKGVAGSIRRQNSGWCDGCYDVVGGHLEEGEPITTALIREAQEEVNITVDPVDARFVHFVQYVADGYLYAFFEARAWKGEPNTPEQPMCIWLLWRIVSAAQARLP